MNAKKIIGIVSAIVLGLVLTLGAIFMPKMLGNKELPNDSNSSNETNKVKPTTPSKDDEKNDEEAEKPVIAEKPKKDFEKTDFKNSEANVAIDGFTKEEVTEAFNVVDEFVNTKMFDPYMVSGQWAKDGYDNKSPYLLVGRYTSDEIVDTINQLDTRKANLSDEIGRYIFFLDPTGEFKGSKACLSELTDSEIKYTGENSCTQNIKIENIEYKGNKADNLNQSLVEFKFDVSADILVENDKGEEYYTTVKYDHQMFLAKNVSNLKDKSKYMIYESTPQVEIDAAKKAGE